MAGALAAYDPADQARRRKRARVTQGEIARRLNVAQSAISEYEHGVDDLPWALTADDYEVALAAAITAKRAVA